MTLFPPPTSSQSPFIPPTLVAIYLHKGANLPLDYWAMFFFLSSSLSLCVNEKKKRGRGCVFCLRVYIKCGLNGFVLVLPQVLSFLRMSKE